MHVSTLTVWLLAIIALGLLAFGLFGHPAHAQEVCRTVDDVERTVARWQTEDATVTVERVGGERARRMIGALNSSIPPRTDWTGAGVIAAVVGGKVRVAVVGADGDVCHGVVLSPRQWEAVRSKSADAI